MTQPLGLSSSTQNSEKLNQAGFKFPPGVIIPVYLQFSGSKPVAGFQFLGRGGTAEIFGKGDVLY